MNTIGYWIPYITSPNTVIQYTENDTFIFAKICLCHKSAHDWMMVKTQLSWLKFRRLKLLVKELVIFQFLPS